MSANGWLQFAIFSAILLASVRPVGIYLARVLEGVGSQQSDGGKAQRRIGILPPVHFFGGIDAAKLVDEPFDRTKDRIQPGALTLQYAG